MVTLYSTNCPRCKVLEMKMQQKEINYTVVTDMDLMLSKGFKSAPTLETDKGEILGFKEALDWIKEWQR